MRYIQLDQLNHDVYEKDVWQLLCKYDHTFIPALSSRESTFQSDLSQQSSQKAEPNLYFENIKNQSILLAINDNNHAIGFMSYKPAYISEDLQDNVETVYITTIIVDEAYRGQGVTSTFYKLIQDIAKQLHKPIMTRTWSTNDAHIHVLNKIGMVEIKRIINARGHNIDTVYFRK